MARDDRKRGGHKGSQPPKAEPEPQTDPVDLFSEEDLDAFLQSPTTAPPAPGAAPPPLQEPENEFQHEEGTGEIDLEDIEEAQDIAVFDEEQAAAKEDLGFDAALDAAVPAAPPPLASPEQDVDAGHPALSAFAQPPTPAPAYAPAAYTPTPAP
ncbi:MAG: hypothetical protein HY906_05075, partial [Deltaproteobacteria bacterium]|nr:hypothetical protein [Deltaproteobacteria bacterium]